MINKTKRGFSIATGVFGILLALFQAVVSFYVFMLIIPMALALAKADQSLINAFSYGGMALVGISVAYIVLSIFMLLTPKVGADGEYKYRKGVNIALIALAVASIAITVVLYALTGSVESETEIGGNLLLFIPTIVYIALLFVTLFIKDKREPAPSENFGQETEVIKIRKK